MLMKKILLTIHVCLLSVTAFGADNPMFTNNTQNTIALHVAQSTGDGTLLKLIQPGLWDISPMTMFMLEYSQPQEIFRLPARINLTLTENIGYHNTHGLSFSAIGVSWDIAVLQWRGFYLGAGIGPYMRNKIDRWVSSRLVFGERIFFGKNISTKWRTEIFTQHFSNGNFTELNRGFNYTGFKISYSF